MQPTGIIYITDPFYPALTFSGKKQSPMSTPFVQSPTPFVQSLFHLETNRAAYLHYSVWPPPSLIKKIFCC